MHPAPNMHDSERMIRHQARRPSVLSPTPWTAYVVNPWIHAQLDLTRNRQEKQHLRHVLIPLACLQLRCWLSLEQLKKEVFKHRGHSATAEPDTAASCSTTRPIRGKKERADCFTLLIFTQTNYHFKVPHFRFRFPGPTCYLVGVCPKGSCHVAESSMSDTPAQNCLIELWSLNTSYMQKHQANPRWNFPYGVAGLEAHMRSIFKFIL